jgi:predicted phage terminase large subunit-like protein
MDMYTHTLEHPIEKSIPKEIRVKEVLNQKNARILIQREINNRSLYEFLKYFWPYVSNDTFSDNFHIKYICDEVQELAERISQNKPKKYDLIINVPPGTSKSTICSIMLPVWCWTKWFWMRFITGSFSEPLALENATYSRDLIRTEVFQEMYPELEIKFDEDNKSNYRLLKKVWNSELQRVYTIKGGNRLSTSVGGRGTGFHAHLILIDDPINPKKAVSDKELQNAIHWMDHTLSMRKTQKEITPTVLIMQRLHENDPTGNWLSKKEKKIKHICLPGEIRNKEYKNLVKPIEMILHYKNGLLDEKRLSEKALKDSLIDLGQYGYAGQVGQNPVPPKGGMFKVSNLITIDSLPNPVNFDRCIRYWDKAGSDEAGAFTVGVKLMRLKNGKYIVMDVQRGQWSSEIREKRIRQVAEADGVKVEIMHEQEPGSGGKDSAKATTLNLAGFHVIADRPSGDKVYRADPFSVQVNDGNVMLLRGEWNQVYIEELRYFPFSKFKDQVDASSGAFNELALGRRVKVY